MRAVPKYVVKNMSTTAAVDDVAAQFGFETVATPVGEIHVAEGMLRVGAFIGGEGGGGVMLTDVHIGRDAPVAAVLLLQLLVWEGKTLSEVKSQLPQYEIVKLTAPLPVRGDTDADHAEALAISQRALDTMEQAYRDKAAANPHIVVTGGDGVRIDFKEEGYWVHLRKSNTEPILRVIGEHRHGQDATRTTCTAMSKELNETIALLRETPSQDE